MSRSLAGEEGVDFAEEGVAAEGEDPDLELGEAYGGGEVEVGVA